MRTDSAEVVCGCKGEVTLEATGQKPDSVDRMPGGEIKELVGGTLCYEFFTRPSYEFRVEASGCAAPVPQMVR